MTALSRILCAVDIDDHARASFAQALALARRTGARLLLICPVPLEESFNQRGPDRVAYLMRLRREAEAAGVDVHTSVQSGEAAEIVLLHAASRRADLIVIGVGHGRAQGRAYGAVAEDVLRSAPCQTLVVPPGAPVRHSFTRVLTAVALDADAMPIDNRLWALEAAPDVAVTMLHVARSGAAARGAQAKVQSLIPESLKSAAVGRVAVGAVATEVLKAARATQADLIVVGARPRNRMARRLFGVTRDVLTSSACHVLALPPRTAAQAVMPRAA